MTTRRLLFSTLTAAPFAIAQATRTPVEKPEDLVWNLETIRWQRKESGGAKYAVIDGDRERPGEPFTYAFWMPPGVWVPAHTHSQQAHVAVLKGAILLGFGKKMEKTKTKAIRAGEFFIVRAGVPHYEGCNEETLIIGSALGGWKTDMLP